MGSKRRVGPDAVTGLDEAGEATPARRGSERRRRPVLRAIAGPAMMQFCVIPSGGRVVLGRGPDCDLRIDDADVSRAHCAVRHLKPASLMLEDLGSTNGTTHNGQPVTAPVRLAEGDLIGLGGWPIRVELLTSDAIAGLADLVARLAEPAVDPATGLLHRRYLDEVVPRQLPLLARARVPCSLVRIELDDGKRLRQLWGAPVADGVFRVLARLVRGTIREHDRAVRYASDAIAIVVPDCDEAGGVAVAERTLAAVSVHDWARVIRPTGADGAPPPLPVFSAGVAMALPEESMTAWLTRCERATYVARRLGGSRVVPASRVAT